MFLHFTTLRVAQDDAQTTATKSHVHRTVQIVPLEVGITVIVRIAGHEQFPIRQDEHGTRVATTIGHKPAVGVPSGVEGTRRLGEDGAPSEKLDQKSHRMEKEFHRDWVKPSYNLSISQGYISHGS